jgi:uncharacterized small protein (DUF1192 family)
MATLEILEQRLAALKQEVSRLKAALSRRVSPGSFSRGHSRG